MAQFKQWFTQDLTESIVVRHCESVMFTGDDNGAVVGVRLYDNGAAYSGGGTVTGAVKRIDGGLVALTGTLSGNAASVVMPAAALAYPGPIGVHIVLTQGSSVTTVLKAIYSVDDNTGTPVDPGDIVPSYEELLGEIAAMRQATADANAAAVAANTARENIQGDLSKIRNAVSSENPIDFVGYGVLETTTHNGITFTVDGRKIHVSGTKTASASSSFFTIYQDALPPGMEIGGKYYVKYDSPSELVMFAIYFYNADYSTRIGAIFPRHDTTITVPSGAERLILRLLVESHEQIDETVEPELLSGYLDPEAAMRSIVSGTLDLGTLIPNTYIQSSNGEAATWNGNSATDFLPCYMAAQLITHIETTNTYAENAFYDKDRKFINSFSMHQGTYTLDVPDNAYFVRFSNVNANIQTLTVTLPNKEETENALAAIQNDIAITNWKGTLFVAPYGTAELTITNSGTTITVNCNRYIALGDKVWKLINMSNPTLTVPHDYYAVYIDSTSTIEVKNEAEVAALTGKYYILFYNSNGQMCGPFETYRNRVAIDEFSRLYPVYYDNHVKAKVDAVNIRLSGIASGDAFVFITDIHYPDNKMYSPALIHDICNKTAINKVILNGDYINKELGSKQNALMQINRVCSLYEYPAVYTYRVVGNHEFNNPGNAQDEQHLAGELSAAELRWAILNPVRNKAVIDPNSLSYYWDNEDQKIRYFVGATTKTSGTVAESIRWIAGQVENVPSGWGVVIFQHTVLSGSGSVHPVNDHLTGIFNAMKAKTSYNYLGTVFDYTAKVFDFIACFCGDYHLDMDYTTTDGALVIATTCDTMQQEGDLPRTSGTYTEQAFDIVTIDRTTRKINLTRIGAGSDREYTF